jgi:hypothetical protein
MCEELFIDYNWSPKERAAVLEGIIKRKGTSLESGDEDLKDLFSTTEIFEGNGITGYLYYHNGLNVKCRAITDKGKQTQICPTNLMKNVEKNIGEPNNGTTDCGEMYGFQTMLGRSTVFKTLNQSDIPTRGFKGSNCAVTSNKNPIIDRINKLYEIIETHNIKELKPLMITSIEYAKITKYDFEKLEDMTAAHLCIYLELLLRAFDKYNVLGKKWALNLVDSARAKGVVRGKDGRLSVKEVFIMQEK